METTNLLLIDEVENTEAFITPQFDLTNLIEGQRIIFVNDETATMIKESFIGADTIVHD